MGRKVIQHGDSTLTISLPFKWVKQYHIKKGSELNVKEIGNKLLISKDNESTSKLCTLNIDDKHFLRRDLVILYKQGFDEIVLQFKEKVPIAKILEKIDELLGFEVVEQGKNYCTIRNVASIPDKEFNAIMRRLFLLTITMAEDLHTSLKEKTIDSTSKGFIMTEKENNKLSNLCQRLLIKTGFSNINHTTTTYSIIDQLEMIGDAMGDLAEKCNSKRIFSTSSLLLFYSLNNYFRQIYELVYRYDQKKLAHIKETRIILYEKIDSALERQKDIILICYLKQYLESLHHIEVALVKV